MTTQRHTATYIEERIATFEDLRREILQLLRWDEEQYNLFVFETGLAYLDTYFGPDAAAKTALSRRPEFWAWWKNHWFCRDQAFLEAMDLVIDCPEAAHHIRHQAYQHLHHPKILACEIYPNRTVLGPHFSTHQLQMA